MATYAIDNNTLSEAEIQLLLRGASSASRRGQGNTVARRISTRLATGLAVVVTAVWLFNTVLLAGLHVG